jgi:hypothetical protein
VFLDEKPVAALSNGVGAAAAANILVVAGSEEILLLDDSGQLIERQTWGRSPGDPVTSIGLLPNGNVIIKTNHGAWQPDADFIGWARVEDATADPDWSRAQPLPASLMQAVSRSYRGHGLSFERVLLDLHSGRFFGAFGVLVYDLVAIVLGFLAVSGLVLWFRGRRNVKRQSNHVNRR